MSTPRSSLSARIRSRFISGILALIPVVVTIAILRFVFRVSSSVLMPVVGPTVDAWPPIARAFISILALVLAVYLLGEFVTNLVGRRVVSVIERVVLKVPLVKPVYAATKQVANAFGAADGEAFKSVVFLEYPRPGLRAIGFTTGQFEDREGARWTTVFVPTTPNPTTGFLHAVPGDQLIQTGYTVEEGIKMVVSLGVLAPE